MEFENITEKIIGCEDKVYNAMGNGFLESDMKVRLKGMQIYLLKIRLLFSSHPCL